MQHIAKDRRRRRPRSQGIHHCDSDRFVVTRMGKVNGVHGDGGGGIAHAMGEKGIVSKREVWQCVARF